MKRLTIFESFVLSTLLCVHESRNVLKKRWKCLPCDMIQSNWFTSPFSDVSVDVSGVPGADLGGGEGRSSHGQNFKTYFFPTTFFDL